jgi:hypothetical protein
MLLQGAEASKGDVAATPHPRELKAFGGKQPAKMFHVGTYPLDGCTIR